MLEILKNPAVWAALSGLAGALGWENADKFFEHMVGAVGAISGLIGMLIGIWKSWKEKH